MQVHIHTHVQVQGAYVEVLFLRLIVGPLFGRFLDATGQKMTSLGQKMTSLGQKMTSLLLSRVDTDLEAFWISKWPGNGTCRQRQ